MAKPKKKKVVALSYKAAKLLATLTKGVPRKEKATEEKRILEEALSGYEFRQYILEHD